MTGGAATARGLARAALIAVALSCVSATAQDRVKLGIYAVTAALPYYVAVDRGYFRDEGIVPEVWRLVGGQANVAGLAAGEIEVAAALVTIEGMAANLARPGVATYLSLNGQNAEHQMEQFVVRSGVPARRLSELKGRRIASAPGPANVAIARAVLGMAGLKAGDYQLAPLDTREHPDALASGAFDAAYTLEPAGTIMRSRGTATLLEAGLIARYVLGDPRAYGWAAGCAARREFIEGRPDVARRFAAAWRRAVRDIAAQPAQARRHLAAHGLAPEAVARDVPLVKFTMVRDLSEKNLQELQRYLDFAVSAGALPVAVAAREFLQRY